MTSKSDVVKAWLDVPTGDVTASATYLADDFRNVDGDGNVLYDKQGYIGMYHMMLGAFTGLQFVLTDLREEDGYVIMQGHFEGTHTGDLDMSPLGVGVIPASGKHIVWPDADVKITVEGGKIVQEEPHGDYRGLAAFLEPLGVTVGAD